MIGCHSFAFFTPVKSYRNTHENVTYLSWTLFPFASCLNQNKRRDSSVGIALGHDWTIGVLHSPSTSPWRGAQLKHRDNFTLPLRLPSSKQARNKEVRGIIVPAADSTFSRPWRFQVGVFLFVMPCSVVVVYQRFGDPCCLHLHPEDGGSMDL
jgi:hypothetical protein